LQVAVYIDAPRGSAAAAEREAALAQERRHLPAAVHTQLSISLLYARGGGMAEGGAEPGSAEEYDSLYPINALRNLAAGEARTELVFLLDVDFVPSAGLLRELQQQRPALLDTLAASRTALVVPAFEVDAAAPMPRVQSSLSALLRRGAASSFHEAHFRHGHGPTDAARWATASAPYEVAFEEYYEPYIIASRAWLPNYDERFRGYGMNKVQHLRAVAAAGARFVVLPLHFAAAHEHAKSAAWTRTLGPAAHPMHKMRIAALYARFKADAPPLPPPPPPHTRAPLAATPSGPAETARSAKKHRGDEGGDGAGADGSPAKRACLPARPPARRPARPRGRQAVRSAA